MREIRKLRRGHGCEQEKGLPDQVLFPGALVRESAVAGLPGGLSEQVQVTADLKTLENILEAARSCKDNRAPRPLVPTELGGESDRAASQVEDGRVARKGFHVTGPCAEGPTSPLLLSWGNAPFSILNLNRKKSDVLRCWGRGRGQRDRTSFG